MLWDWLCLLFIFHREKPDTNVFEVFWAVCSDSSVAETPTRTCTLAHAHCSHESMRCSLTVEREGSDSSCQRLHARSSVPGHAAPFALFPQQECCRPCEGVNGSLQKCKCTVTRQALHSFQRSLLQGSCGFCFDESMSGDGIQVLASRVRRFLMFRFG